MRNVRLLALLSLLGPLLGACRLNLEVEKSDVVGFFDQTESVAFEAVDPALWARPGPNGQVYVLGTDFNDVNGALYGFDLEGRARDGIDSLRSPWRVDVEQLVSTGAGPVDIAVVVERGNSALRIFRMPDFAPLDGGGIVLFQGQGIQLSGVATYKRPNDGTLFLLVSHRNGNRLQENNITQYQVFTEFSGRFFLSPVRQFGRFSGEGEIDDIVVDDEMGFLYYIDRGFGVRKYNVDPTVQNANEELATLATEGYLAERSGLALYPSGANSGYLVVAEARDTTLLHFYPREGTGSDPHQHPELGVVKIASQRSTGIDITARAIGPNYRNGMLIAASRNLYFDYYRWEDVVQALNRP